MEYKLEDICEFIRNGANIKQNDNIIGYPITRIETIASSYIDLNRVGYAGIIELGKYEEYLLNDGDILMSHINSEKHLGKTALYEKCNEKIIHGMNLLCLRPKKNIVEPRYLNYYFNNLIFKRQLPKIIKKSVNQASFSVTDLKNIKVILPNKDMQLKVIKKLDKAQDLIDKRKEQIKELDELVKSQFIEMFGDPAFNTKNWKVVELGYLLREKASNGFFAKNDEYKINGNSKVMWLGDIINRRYSNIYELKSVDVTEVQLNKYRVQYGDLLFCRSSLNKEGIGKASAVPKNVDNNIMFECHIIRIPLDLSKCVPEFIQVQSTLHYFRNQIISNAKTATMTTISQDGIVTTKLILPDLELQRKFVETVYQIDKLKFEMENSLKELEDNFNSLMQKAFKGELFI